MGAAPTRVMRQRLAMKADQVGLWHRRQHDGMRGFHHLGRRRHLRITWPLAKSGTDGLALRRAVGPVRRGAELPDAGAVGLQKRGIDTIQRGARHEAKRPKRLRP